MKDNECCIWMQQEDNQTTLNVYFGGPAIFTVDDRRVGGTDYVVGKVGHLLPQGVIVRAVMIGTTFASFVYAGLHDLEEAVAAACSAVEELGLVCLKLHELPDGPEDVEEEED